MAARGSSQVVRQRLLGLGFLAVLVACPLLLLGILNHTFVRSEPLFVEARAAGGQLNADADVKLRGIFVGRVADSEVRDGVVRLELAISPDRMGDIPADVEVAILPKSVFGQKFVDLQIPEGSTAGPIASGATVPVSRSTTALEAEEALDSMVPLLRAVQPGELNLVLEQMATALQGRGDALGDHVGNAQRYLEGFEPSLPDVVENVSLLATAADSYDRAAPDLLRLLDRLAVTTRTLGDQQDVLADFLAGTDEFDATLEQVLADNEERLVRFTGEGRPVAETLATDRVGVGKFFEMFALSWDGGIETLANPANNPKFGRSADETAPYLTISIEVSPGKGEMSAAGYFSCARYGPHFGAEPGAQNPSCVEGSPPPPLGGEENPLEQAIGELGLSSLSTGGGESAPPGDVPPLELPGFGAMGGAPEEMDLLAELLGPTMGRPAEEVPDVAGMLLGSLSGERTPVLGENRRTPAPRSGRSPSPETGGGSLLGGLLR